MRKYFLIFVVLCASVLTGCVPMAISQAVSEESFQFSMREVYLDQAQALRLDEGLSLEEFDGEMWVYAPDQYSEVLEDRIRVYVFKYGAWRTNGNGRGQRGTFNLQKAISEFPELESQYSAIAEKKKKYAENETFWDMKSMSYRAFRLRDNTPEATIIEELRSSDLLFEKRYERYEKGLDPIKERRSLTF